MLVRGMRKPIRRAGTDLGDETGLALSENGPRPTKTSSFNSDRVMSLKGRVAAGLSTDMTRRSRDIDILHATADEHYDILENGSHFQCQDESVDTRRSIPIRGIPRPLDHDYTLRFRRNGRTSSAVGTSNGPIYQPSPKATAADLKGMLNHGVRQSASAVADGQTMPNGAIISPPESSTSGNDDDLPKPRRRRIETPKKLHDAMGPGSIQRQTTQAGGTTSAQHVEQMLLQAGINPSTMNPEQFATFQNQSPAVQQKTIQTYAANLQQQQSQQMGKPMPNANGPPGQGSPMARVAQAPDGATINSFYNAEGMAAAPPGAMRGPGGPNATQQAGGSNHALQDYQMQMMLLEQQNKKRLMMARMEDGGNSMPMPRDGPGGPGAPPTQKQNSHNSSPSQSVHPLPHIGPMERDPREPAQDPHRFLTIPDQLNAPQSQSHRERVHDILNPPQPDAIHSAMSKVPLARKKTNLPGRGTDINPKDNDPKSTTNATISRDHTMGADARRVELLRNWGSKMNKLVTGPSLPVDSDSDTIRSTLSRSSTPDSSGT